MGVIGNWYRGRRILGWDSAEASGANILFLHFGDMSWIFCILHLLFRLVGSVKTCFKVCAFG